MNARAAPLLAILVLAATPASRAAEAEDRPPTADEPRFVEATAAGLGGLVHREATGGVDVLFGAGGWGVRLALAAPLRFDRDGLRPADWDERSDFGRIVADLGYGRPGDDLNVHLAPIRGFSLGVGDLVSLFASTVDPDHWRTGVAATLHWDPAGGDLFLDDFLDPKVLGARAYLRPLHFVAPGGWLARLEIGGTFVADLKAPEFDASTRRLWAGGLDLRWPVFRVDEADVTVYGSWARLGTGMGWTVGLAFEAAPTRSVRLRLAGEWRHLGAGYAAGYFDGLYEADRYAFLDKGPKAEALDAQKDARMGLMAGLGLEVRPWARGWVVLDLDGQGGFNRLRGGIAVRVPKALDLSFEAAAGGFRTAADLRAPDRRTAAVVAEVPIYRYLSIFGSYARDLAVDTVAPGHCDPSDSFFLGLRAGLAWESASGAVGKSASP